MIPYTSLNVLTVKTTGAQLSGHCTNTVSLNPSASDKPPLRKAKQKDTWPVKL